MKNRQYVSFTYLDFEISATTAPLKLRFKDKFDTINVNTELTTQADINLNFMARFGKVTYSYDKYAGMTSKNAYSGVAGGFIGLGALQLTAANTMSRVLTSDTAGFNSGTGLMVPSFSFGASVGVNFYGVELGAMLGYEVPLQHSNIWDYRRVPFIGFGIGYGIGFVN